MNHVAQAPVKVENKILTLNASLRPLKADYIVPVGREIASVAVSRNFFSSVYGGNMIETFPTIAPNHVERHGMKNFMFLTTEFNPNAPLTPGQSGLFFGGGEDGEWEEIMRVFVRIAPGRWRFMGLYRLTSMPSLTPEEWQDQKPKVSP